MVADNPFPNSVVTADVTRFSTAGNVEQTELLANEVRVALVYNGLAHTVMMASPQDLKVFAIGFTLSERIVSTINDIKDIELEYVSNGVIIKIEINQRCFNELKEHRRSMAGRTGCGLCGVAQLKDAVKPVQVVGSDIRFNIAHLDPILVRVKQLQQTFALTGATHAAIGVNENGEVIYLFEDIGRHIALDKLIGAMSVRYAAKPAAVLLTSRASFEMVQKAASVGIQILFAMSAVTALATEIAEQSNVTLVGFCRDGRANIYNHGYRLQGSQLSQPAVVGL